MKHKIIKTDNYLLVVDESEIKVNDFMYFWNGQSGSIHKHKEGYATENIYGAGVKIIAHLPLNGSPILEGVDLLPKLYEQRTEITLEPEHIELLNQGNVEYFNDRIEYTLPQKFIKEGDKWFIEKTISKEKYKYTEDDLRKAIQLAWEADSIDGTVDLNIVLHYGDNNDLRTKWSEDEIIQSLSQPKMPIGFERYYNYVPTMLGEHIAEPKTTTTPEGHTQWVGTYIYE